MKKELLYNIGIVLIYCLLLLAVIWWMLNYKEKVHEEYKSYKEQV